MNKIFLALVSLFFFASTVNAQEICNDGIDNDGDGFIDCFDSDCSDSSDCDGFYIGNDASCEAIPNQFPVFTLSLGYQSRNDVTNHLGRIAIGDLDRDGIPEIATQNRNTGKVYILNGADASIKWEANVRSPQWRMSIANLEDDDCAEVFAVSYDNGYKIVSFDCELNKNWTSEALRGDPINLGYADFDRDGVAEMYYKDEIRDPITGTRLIRGLENWGNIGGGPIAVDIFGDEDLELVLNNKIYRVNLGARTADAGNLTLLATMPEPYKVRRNENATTSIADYNLDGFLDIIITGANNDDVTTVFFWDVRNNTVKTFSDRVDANGYRNGWKNGTGRINIGDLDGDGQLNAVFVSGKYLYALDENWLPLWKDEFGNPEPTVVNEETSGYTGCTLFDFNGDSKMEVVYRDEDYLYIVNGTDGSIGTSVHCRSRTSIEYPIVADVDADGSTEICVLCATETSNTGSSGAQLGLYTPAEVRIYKSGGEPWVPARRLWNQHGYFNVNINDDLTVPRNQQKHQLVFSTGTCTEGPARPLNGFLNQSPFLNSSGCPTYASPDITIIENSLSIEQPVCPETDFTISFEFENIGDVALSGNIPITFYDGDPLQPGANKLGTEFITLNNFTVGQIGTAQDIIVSGSGGPFTFYAVLNDFGTSTPSPITLPNSNFLECDYANNIVSGELNPTVFNLTTETTNNITCTGSTVPANGSARVFQLINGVEETASNDFFWFNGTDLSGAPDYVGSIYTGLSAGTYSVYAVNKFAGCSSDTVQVQIIDSATAINAEIVVDRPLTNCRRPNGKLTVNVIEDGVPQPVGKYNYEWYVGNTVGGGAIISTSQIANNLETGVFTVLVTEKSTGCQTIESMEVPDEAGTPEFTASAVDIICSGAASGSVSAILTVGDENDHTFEWFIGPSVKPTADYTGSTVAGLPAGEYTVVVLNDRSQCYSAPITVTIGQTLPPEISSISGTDNTSCDASQPNGTVTVDIVGNAADHTIEWFAGGSTSSPFVGNNLTETGLVGGQYTVRLTNNATACFVTDQVTIINNVVKPVVSLTVEPVTVCSPFNGRITANVDVDALSDYTFSWYDGSQVKASPDFTETGNILSNLAPGFYTVSATNTSRNCVADAQTIEVIDEATITITQTAGALSLPSDCNAQDGSMQVEVSSPNNVSGFLIEWFRTETPLGAPIFSETGVAISIITNLGTGLYTVRATDLDNGCSDQQIFDLPFVNAQELDIISVTNTSTCDPNNEGAISVRLTIPVLAGIDETNYFINLYTASDLNTPISSQQGIAGQTDYDFVGLTNDSYVIEAVSDGGLGNCSVFTLADVEQDVTIPVIDELNNLPNINCSTLNATGSIEIDINGGADPLLYTINWYEGNDTSSPVLGTSTGATAGTNNEIANNLIAGNYTVEVIDNATLCSATKTFGVVDNPTIVSINDSEILINQITRCDIINSEVTIPTVNENGIPGNLADYIFEWRDEAGNLLPIGGPINTTNTISGLDIGNYTVKAINTVTDCQTTFNDFEIFNETTAPTITLDFLSPEICVVPSMGELHVNATGPAISYSYNWYDGPDNSGPITQTGPDYVGLSEGIYTVEITDNSSNCTYTETYNLLTVVNVITLSTSSTPVTSCDSPDGTAFARVTSAGNYSYSWTDSNGNIVGTGRDLSNLDVGDYTVVAVDDTNGSCIVTETVSVLIDQLFPVLSLTQIAPVTVCDLRLANGAARALADGGFIGYTFEWFEGNSTSGTPVFTGPEISQLQDITYTVRATDVISQCFSEQTITISSDIPTVAIPTIDVVSQDTHCEIENGELSVSVDGNTSKYIFNWYEGDRVTNSPDFTGERLTSLPAGEYTVTATEIRTGCVSPPVTAEILEELKFPEFNFKIEGVNCDESNGFASVRMTNDVEIKRIEWRDAVGNLLTVGPNLADVPGGVYSVLIETALGCLAEEEITIPTEVNPYNGISRNGDSRNSFFQIDCITDYPENVVKIYNRAGTLIYEIDGYDNNSKIFDGESNRGVNLMGQNVPDGTYFYVIDKNNGSKPLTGYLEIVN